MESRSVPRPSGFSLPLMIAAVAAGVAAGLLFAPRPGSAMRATVRHRATDAGQRFRTYAASTYEWVQQRFNGPTGVRTPEVPAHLTATMGEVAGVDAAGATRWGVTS